MFEVEIDVNFLDGKVKFDNRYWYVKNVVMEWNKNFRCICLFVFREVVDLFFDYFIFLEEGEVV